jgi:hypothetical protein
MQEVGKRKTSLTGIGNHHVVRFQTVSRLKSSTSPNTLKRGPISGQRISSPETVFGRPSLGLSPNKSLTIQFPKMPVSVARHFIRGCWDGDGSVYIDRRTGNVCASFVSGSYDFIQGMVKELNGLGFSTRTIHRYHKSFYFRFTGNECVKLYHFLYDGVPGDMYLSRKRCVFESGFQK